MDMKHSTIYRDQIKVEDQVVVAMSASISKDEPNSIFFSIYDKELHAKNLKECREGMTKFMEEIWKEEDELLGKKKVKK